MPTHQTHEPERPVFNNMASLFYFGIMSKWKKELDILIDQPNENMHAQQLERKKIVVGPDPLISNSSPRATKTQETNYIRTRGFP